MKNERYDIIKQGVGIIQSKESYKEAWESFNEYCDKDDSVYYLIRYETGKIIETFYPSPKITAMVSDYCLPDYWTGHSGNVIIAYPYFELTRPELIDELMDDLDSLYTGDDEYCIPESITNEEIYKALDNEIAHFEKFGDIFPDAPKLDDIDDCMDSPILYVALSME